MDDSDEDFGYDFSPDEEQLLLQLASASPTITSVTQQQHQAAATIDSLPGKETDISTQVSRVKNEPASVGGMASADAGIDQNWSAEDAMPLQVEVSAVAYPNLSRALEELGSKAGEEKLAEEPGSEEELDDDRSPLQRFRSFPRRPLTVTDLTAGAWCELQYWYTLTKLPGGRRTRTAAMREGSKVHQNLEDEVHTTVRVEVTSREDAFGLRLWNFIQGLRTLRDTGLTRELEVWGMLNGNLVNGVIDVVSYESPNPEFEDELDLGSPSQPKMTDFFAVEKPKKQPKSTKKIYLTDVKTRGSAAPVSKVLLRPAKIQLLLYHRFLSEMANDKIDLFHVMRRYGLDADEPFSDGFLAQIGSLHDEIFGFTSPKSSIEAPGGSATDSTPQAGTDSSNMASQLLSTPDIVKYSSLRELVSLVKEETQLTFPDGSGCMGNMLQVQYVHREDGRLLDLHDFPVSATALEEYLGSYMKWWKGERKATGVEIEEAFKCRTCEFAESCSWRRNMDNELVMKARAKSRSVTA